MFLCSASFFHPSFLFRLFCDSLPHYIITLCIALKSVPLMINFVTFRISIAPNDNNNNNGHFSRLYVLSFDIRRILIFLPIEGYFVIFLALSTISLFTLVFLYICSANRFAFRCLQFIIYLFCNLICCCCCYSIRSQHSEHVENNGSFSFLSPSLYRSMFRQFFVLLFYVCKL